MQKQTPKLEKTLKKRLAKTARRYAYGVKSRADSVRELGRLVHFSATDDKEKVGARDWLDAVYFILMEPVLSKFIFQPATEVGRLASFVPVLWRNYDWEGSSSSQK